LICSNVSEHLLGCSWFKGHTQAVDLSLSWQHIPTSQEICWCTQFRAILSRADRYIKNNWLICDCKIDLALRDIEIFVIIRWLIPWDKTAKNQNLWTWNLHRAWWDNLQSVWFRYVVYGLPYVFLNLIHLNFLNKIKRFIEIKFQGLFLIFNKQLCARF